MLQALEEILKGLKILTSMPCEETPNYLGDPPHGSPRWYAQQYFHRVGNRVEAMRTRLLARREPRLVDLTPEEIRLLVERPQHHAVKAVRDRLGCSLRDAAGVVEAFQAVNGRRAELYPYPTAPCAREGCSGKARDASPGADEHLAYCSMECASPPTSMDDNFYARRG